MEPITGLYLTCLAGYWIFRGLEHLASQQSDGSGASTARTTPFPQQPTAHHIPAPSYVVVPPRVVESPRARYGSASSLFEAEYVSYSRLRYYAECPHKFRLAYLEGHREISSGGFTGDGSRFHEHCESFFGSQSGQTFEALREKHAGELIDRRTRFILSVMPSSSRVVASEHKLRFTLRDTSYFGIVDLIAEDDDGVTRLVDFKTGKTPRPHLEQLELYCLPVLLRSPQATVRCSFVLVDAREIITWEVGPHNRNEVIGNLIRRVNHIRADTAFLPFVSSKCKDCGFAHACHHRRQASTTTRPSETLTSAKRGAEGRRRPVAKIPRSREPMQPRRPQNSASYFAVFGKADYRCDETGDRILTGVLHYATRKGHRLSAVGFRRRFPGVPLPSERPRRG